MKHTTKVTKQEQITDEMIMIEITCCGDGRTASRTSMYALADADDMNQRIDEHHSYVAKRHEAMNKGKELLRGLGESEKEHEL